MLTPQQTERSAGIGIDRIQGTVSAILTAKPGRPFACILIRVCHHIQQFVIKGTDRMCAVDTVYPAVIKMMHQIG